MAKLKLNPEPTFKADVPVPVPGAGPVKVKFTFKWRKRDEIVDWLESAKDMTDAEIIMDSAIGWELDDEFNAENAERLCNTYTGAGREFVNTYLDELRGVRTKN
ncbi:TfmS protein [Lysobacter dokdonensis DS-58]|uniref:TfmS protein n=1 Tax=Lysobacter dokdonensis DS-58 TaxID=1300345 RepID=A0A0A2X3U7_9GAMM|nr:phage tail assembly chaperone [Lysobacter dokdonensis]KGQ19934.1 TfmS protein [Lysobacter dokdonensis DS-58]